MKSEEGDEGSGGDDEMKAERNWEWEGENCKNGVGFGIGGWAKKIKKIDGGGGNK